MFIDYIGSRRRLYSEHFGILYTETKGKTTYLFYTFYNRNQRPVNDFNMLFELEFMEIDENINPFEKIIDFKRRTIYIHSSIRTVKYIL